MKFFSIYIYIYIYIYKGGPQPPTNNVSPSSLLQVQINLHPSFYLKN